MALRHRKFSPEFRDEAVKMVVVESRLIAEVAREIQVLQPEILRVGDRWDRQEQAGEESPVNIGERSRLRELEREDRELRVKTGFPGKAAVFFAQEYRCRRSTSSSTARPVTFRAADAHLGGSNHAGPLHWRSRPLPATAKHRAEVWAVILQVFPDSQETYGYRRAHAALQRMNVQAGAELIRALMHEPGPVPYRPRALAGDHDRRQRPACRPVTSPLTLPGRKLVSDSTYAHTWAGFPYLTTVIDCHTKAVAGWAMASTVSSSARRAAISASSSSLVAALTGTSFVFVLVTPLSLRRARSARTGVAQRLPADSQVLADAFEGVARVRQVQRDGVRFELGRDSAA